MEPTTHQFIDECIDPAFGYENEDGYVRILNKQRKDGGRLVMRHRWFWELEKGPIPFGMEIDHLCKNRRCCNYRHLRLITRTHHAILTNQERSIKDKEFKMFLELYKEEKRPANYYSNEIGVSLTTIYKWLKYVRVVYVNQ